MIPSTLEVRLDGQNSPAIPKLPQMAVTVVTGGIDRPYVFGLTMALISQNIHLDVIGSDTLERPEMHTTAGLRFLNLQSDAPAGATRARRACAVLAFYSGLLRYIVTSKAKVFHILWNNKLQLLDRTLLMLFYKACGKKLVLTAHNVNAAKRDNTDSFLNRLTLKIQYRLVNHIFVHTEPMKTELVSDFGVTESAVTVIPFGINNAVPDTDLTRAEARRKLGIGEGERTVLFFGRIGLYKGLDVLVDAFRQAACKGVDRLIIAGNPKAGSEEHLREVRNVIESEALCGYITARIEYIPDEDTELYFKAADALILPYRSIFQSGVLFLAYSFGLPVIASDVGPFRDDVVEGETGFLCRPGDAQDLARVMSKYFESPLFETLEDRRQSIRDYAEVRHSWRVVGKMTRHVYAGLLGGQHS